MQTDQCFKRHIPEVWSLVAQHCVQHTVQLAVILN
jgi:hypothetical protein